TALGRIGRTLLELGQRDKGIEALRRSLAIRQALVRDDPANVLWQTDLAAVLYALAHAGENARANLEQALEIMRQLDRQGKLGPEQDGWIARLQSELDALPK